MAPQLGQGREKHSAMCSFSKAPTVDPHTVLMSRFPNPDSATSPWCFAQSSCSVPCSVPYVLVRRRRSSSAPFHIPLMREQLTIWLSALASRCYQDVNAPKRVTPYPGVKDPRSQLNDRLDYGHSLVIAEPVRAPCAAGYKASHSILQQRCRQTYKNSGGHPILLSLEEACVARTKSNERTSRGV